ncbi:MAG: DUF2971 domain-containing protein [Clostridiaceae bacterium]|nr:DUF2971 domain-containing protein [Clostridiaceae bacterium]
MSNLIYHYCSVESFENIINNKTIRLSEVSKTNDYMEQKYALKKILEEVMKKYRSIDFKDIDFINSFYEKSTPVLVLCFSENGDKLCQWTNYASNGRGIAIGFDYTLLKKINEFNNESISIDKIKYRDEEQSQIISPIVNEVIKQLESNEKKDEDEFKNYLSIILNLLIYSGNKNFNNLSCKMKDSAFSDEEEVRIIFSPNLCKLSKVEDFKGCGQIETKPFKFGTLKYKTKNGNLVLYADLSFQDCIKDNIIKDIVIGPGCKVSEKDVKYFLIGNGYNYKEINIRKSKIPYRAKE